MITGKRRPLVMKDMFLLTKSSKLPPFVASVIELTQDQLFYGPNMCSLLPSLCHIRQNTHSFLVNCIYFFVKTCQLHLGQKNSRPDLLVWHLSVSFIYPGHPSVSFISPMLTGPLLDRDPLLTWMGFFCRLETEQGPTVLPQMEGLCNIS